MKLFQALIASQDPDGRFNLQLSHQERDRLPAGDVLIRVQYSSLNYKDALSATGKPGITRHYPHIPGIDAAGRVEESQVADIQPGDAVIVTGFDLGMNTSGGFAEYIRVPHTWVIPCPQPLSLFKSMAYGTAGLTAALCVHKLQNHQILPETGKILVTGATGGVGSLSVALLARLGYSVVAVTGKSDLHPYLLKLGATAVVDRPAIADTSGKPLLSGDYAGAIDTVGGNTLASVIKRVGYGGVVTACGMAQSPELQTTVYPFILRGVSLLGVDSAACDRALRIELWNRLAESWAVTALNDIVTEVSLAQVPAKVQQMLAGQLVGRTVINLT